MIGIYPLFLGYITIYWFQVGASYYPLGYWFKFFGLFQHVFRKPFEILGQYLVTYCYTAFYKTSNFEFAKTMPPL